MIIKKNSEVNLLKALKLIRYIKVGSYYLIRYISKKY